MNEKPNIAASFLRMNLENDPLAFEPGEFSFVLNGVITNFENGLPFISNTLGTEVNAVYPLGFTPIGNAKIDSNSRVIFLVNESTDEGQIGILKNNVYESRVTDTEFKFNINSPIKAKCKRLYNGHIIVYWVDHNPMRRLDLDAIPYVKVKDANGNITVTTKLDADQIKIFKNYENPDFRISKIDNVGSVLSGGYYITTQYADARGNGLTACARLSNKISIIEDSPDTAFESITGIASGKATNKAIRVELKTVDLSFSFINIIVVSVIDAGIRSYRVATIPISQKDYLFTGLETKVAMLLEEVTAVQTVYDSAETIEESDGSLLLGNVKAKLKLNLQPYVNQIQLQWVAYRAKANNRQKTFKNPLFAAYNQCYRRDEVVPLGIVFELTDGSITDAFPFVGREANKKASGLPFTNTQDAYGSAVTPAAWDTMIIPMNRDNFENQNTARWKLYNTGTIEGNKLVPGAEEGLSYFGELSYFQTDGTYPNVPAVWGSLAGQPIRHPKMPDSSILHLHDGFMENRTSDEVPYLYYLGFQFPNIDEVINNLPADLKAKIKTWRIVRADRSREKTIQASGILFNCLEQQFKTRNGDADDYRLYPNYPLNDLRPDPYTNKISSVLEDNLNIHKNDRYSKKHFTFCSPDTSLKTAILSESELKIESEVYGQALTYHYAVPEYPTFTERGDKKSKAALVGLCIGKYNNFKKPVLGNIRRRLEEILYLPANSQISGGNSGRRIWNKMRESSVFLSLTEEVDNPTVQDRSRFILTNEEENLLPGEQYNCANDVAAKRNRPVSAYYVSIKRNLTSIYNDVTKLKFIDTGISQEIYKDMQACFGGDTYVCGFALKRQLPFFEDVERWINSGSGGDGINFSATATLPGNRYYYRNTGSNPRKASQMMCEDNTGSFFGDGDGKELGFLTLTLFGVPCFWVESDINVDLRNEGTVASDAIYPSLLSGATNIENWLSVKNVSIDNYFEQNGDFSGKDDLNVYFTTPADYDPSNADQTEFTTRVLKSLRSQPEDIYDNWQVFKPLDYYDFIKSRGPLVDIRYIGENRTIFRFKEGLFIARVLNTMTTSEGQIAIGAGRLFSQEPTELGYTDNGHLGTMSKFAYDVTPFGSFMVNAEQGKVFRYGDQIEEVSNKKAFSWFLKHLPFHLSKEIPGIPTDNAYNPNGIGIISFYDATQKLWYLTKKDYELVNKQHLNSVTYDNGHVFIQGNPVSLKDPAYFRNRSFTIAYSPERDGWFSFYSFIPDMYLTIDNLMLSTITELGQSAAHRHHVNTFKIYGKKQPFIIEVVQKADGNVNYISNSQLFDTRAFIKQGSSMVPVDNKTFNKAIVYSEFECSGLMELIVQDENNLAALYKKLTNTVSSRKVALRLRNAKWSFSDYWDIATANNFFSEEWDDAMKEQYFIDKVLNPAVLNYNKVYSSMPAIRGEYTKVRFIYDGAEELKLLFQLSIETTRPSYS